MRLKKNSKILRNNSRWEIVDKGSSLSNTKSKNTLRKDKGQSTILTANILKEEVWIICVLFACPVFFKLAAFEALG